MTSSGACAGASAGLYLLLEFQSTVDRLMAVRLLTYVGLLYQDLAAAGEIPPGGPLPPVLPIVLYNGQALPKWADDCLARASAAELESWTDRVLDARTLEDVFPRGRVESQEN